MSKLYRHKFSVLLFVFIFSLLVFSFAISSSRSDCGDVNDDGSINILDITYLINYLYASGPAPVDLNAADVNNSGDINILDITGLIVNLYGGGSPLDCPASGPELPSHFDLRDSSKVTSVKSQSGGTCWTHGTMASIESNLLVTGIWAAAGEFGEPNLAEYHLDWWNGFNGYWNPDYDYGGGLELHYGGDYRVSSAYLSREGGAVRDIDGQSYNDPPAYRDHTYHYYFVRDIDWYSTDEQLNNIETIKNKLIEHGAIATAYCADGDLLYDGYIVYQDPSDSREPTHAVAIIGWDDDLITPASQPGAWICKNSWNTTWGYDGFFYISYYDKWCCKEADMGAVSFYNVEPMQWDVIHYHDTHGYGSDLFGVNEAFNRFVATTNEFAEAVSFFTISDSVDYEVKLFGRFEGGQLLDELSSVTGFKEFRGFTTVDLPESIKFINGDTFYVYLSVSDGIHAIDISHEIPVLLDKKYRAWVESDANPGESFYYSGGQWNDLTGAHSTGNLCIKAYGINASMIVRGADEFYSEGPAGGPFTPSIESYTLSHRYDDPISYNAYVDPSIDWISLSSNSSGSLNPNTNLTITATINSLAGDLVEGKHTATIYFQNLDYSEDDTTRQVTLIVGTPRTQMEWTLDSDPGWDCEGEWEYGSPTGGGGYMGFGYDPVGGYTGDYVYGYNIDGNYPDTDLVANLTVGPLDFSKYIKTSVNYMKWLASDGWGYGQFKISVDGANWSTIWSGSDGVNGLVWTNSEFDLAEYLDYQSTVYLRWVMMVEFNPSNTFGGWNLDDIEVKAIFDSTLLKSE